MIQRNHENENGHNGHHNTHINNTNGNTNGNTLRIQRETAGNTLGIQILTNPSTPSATPTPVPNTPELNQTHSNRTQPTPSQPTQSQPAQRRTSHKTFPSTFEENDENYPALAPLPSGSKIANIQLTKVRSDRNIDSEVDDEKFVNQGILILYLHILYIVVVTTQFRIEYHQYIYRKNRSEYI